MMTDLAVGNFSGSTIKAGYEEEVFSGTIASGETLVIDKALSLAPPTISNIAVSNITGKSAVILGHRPTGRQFY